MHIMISQVMPVRETSLHSVVAIRRAIGALGGFKEVLEELPDVADSSQVRLPCCVLMVAHVVLRVDQSRIELDGLRAKVAQLEAQLEGICLRTQRTHRMSCCARQGAPTCNRASASACVSGCDVNLVAAVLTPGALSLPNPRSL